MLLHVWLAQELQPLWSEWRSAGGGRRTETKDIEMQTGTVKWFNDGLGYGYIAPADGSPDVFVHFTALDLSGLKSLGPGQTVVFHAAREGGIVRATNLRVAVAA